MSINYNLLCLNYGLDFITRCLDRKNALIEVPKKYNKLL